MPKRVVSEAAQRVMEDVPSSSDADDDVPQPSTRPKKSAKRGPGATAGKVIAPAALPAQQASVVRNKEKVLVLSTRGITYRYAAAAAAADGDHRTANSARSACLAYARKHIDYA